MSVQLSTTEPPRYGLGPGYKHELRRLRLAAWSSVRAPDR
jgi:hypothetical protein